MRDASRRLEVGGPVFDNERRMRLEKCLVVRDEDGSHGDCMRSDEKVHQAEAFARRGELGTQGAIGVRGPRVPRQKFDRSEETVEAGA